MTRRVPDCHPLRPYYARGFCRNCYERDLRDRNTAFAERQRQNARTWVESNGARKRAVDLQYRESLDPTRRTLQAKYRRWAKLGVTPEQGEKVLAQTLVCPICRDDFGARGPDLDHDHVTGKARGFLCPRCNKMLGLAGDSLDLLQRAQEYLKDPPLQTEDDA